MRVCAISDLHGFLPEIEPCDLLLICGDIMPLSIQSKMPASEKWLDEVFIPWIDNQLIDQAILIAGNHDYYMERCDKKASLILNTKKLTYLRNESTTYVSNYGESITIFGTPYCKIFGNWAFMRDPDTLKEKYSAIPENVDILISHDAPYGVSDILLQSDMYTGEHIGNKQLAEAILEKFPKLVIHGHLHSTSRNFENLGDSKVINCSIVDEHYSFVYPPIYFNFP